MYNENCVSCCLCYLRPHCKHGKAKLKFHCKNSKYVVGSMLLYFSAFLSAVVHRGVLLKICNKIIKNICSF